MIRKVLFIIMLATLTSCSSFIAKMHREFDKADQKRANNSSNQDKFALYRSNNQGNSNQLTTRNKKVLYPGTKRKYGTIQKARKRYSADDLVDSGNSASLWSGKGRDNYLFSLNTEKHTGDIIIINVLKELKNEISSELRKAYPKRSTSPKSKAPEQKTPQAAQAAAPGQKEADDEPKIHDKISSVIIEEINKDHLLLRGRKSILFRNRKRTVEVQALVQRKNISGDGTIKSDQIIESTISVLR